MSITGSELAQLYAQAGVMRAGTSRANGTSTLCFVAIAGVQYGAARADDTQKVLDDSVTINEVDGATPNTASFRVKGFQPVDGQDVVITLGSINNLERQFAGTVISDTHEYVGTPANGEDVVNVIDYTWHLTRETITQRWTNESGTVIARAILAHANRGFTSLLVEDGLPMLDEFTVTNQTHATALSNLAQRLGATWKATYHKDCRFGFTASPGDTDPQPLTEASALLTGMEAFSVKRDLSQVITRQPVEGGGSNALTEIPPGDTILPVADAGWYNPLGGLVVSGPQRLTYTGLQPGGAGSVVGPSAAPVVAPMAVLAGGGSVDTGDHDYAYVFGTAAGRSLPSPLKRITTSTTPWAPPTMAPNAPLTGVGGGVGLTNGTSYQWLITYAIDATHETTVGPASVAVVADGVHLVLITLPSMPPGPSVSPTGIYTPVRIYRLIAGTYYREPFFSGVAVDLAVGAGLYVGGLGAADADLVAANVQPPAVNTAIPATVALSGIALGPAGTTYRDVYGTPAGSAQLKLVATMANNTATTYVVTSADSALGANAPTSDTSGLSTVTGHVNAGSTSILTPSAGPFSSTGGWARNGEQFIRYTGIAGNTLTGIPATGRGAILNTLNYGDHLDPAPALTGIPASGLGSILYTIHQGDPVNLRVVVNDLAAQAVIAALMLPVVDDGVIEGDVIQDGRISETEARARGLAKIELRKAIDVAVNYTTRDLNTHPPRDIGVDLPAPTNVTATFKLRSVSITSYQPALWPTRTVQAGSRFTLESLLRQLRGSEGT